MPALTLTPDLLPEELADHVMDLLAGLGDTPDAIAARLAAAGITGTLSDASCCPIAAWLRRVEPGLDLAAVLGDVIYLRTGTGVETTVTTPDAVNEFTALFDTGRYPSLIASVLPGTAADPGTTGTEARP